MMMLLIFIYYFIYPVAADGGGGGILLLYGVVVRTGGVLKFCIFLETFNVNRYLKLTLSIKRHGRE